MEGGKLLSSLIGSSRFLNNFQLTGFKAGWEGKSDKLKGVEQELNLSSEALLGRVSDGCYTYKE
jgi:hypothetical protein